MVNFSDLSKMAGKLDVSSLVKNVKEMVNPGHAADAAAGATPVSSDALSRKIAEITASIQALTAAHAKQAEQIAKLNQALEALTIQAATAAASATQPSTTEAVTPAADKTDKPDADTTNKI